MMIYFGLDKSEKSAKMYGTSGHLTETKRRLKKYTKSGSKVYIIIQ